MIEQLKNNNKIFFIHYSSTNFNSNNVITTSIAIKPLKTGEPYLFSIFKEAGFKKIKLEEIEKHYVKLEKIILKKYFDFVKKHKDYYWFHWNMRNDKYGFSFLENNCIKLGCKPTFIKDNYKIDLSKLIYEKYGEYNNHPRFKNLAIGNQINIIGYLDGEEELLTFKNKEYRMVDNSVLRKVDILNDFWMKIKLNKFIIKKEGVIMVKNKTNSKVFLSYSWSTGVEANKIDEVFKEQKIPLLRDINNLNFKDGIKEFMNEIRSCDFVIAIISDKYLKSANCMYETLQLMRNDNYKDKILPVISSVKNNIPKIYSAEEKLDYIAYWNDKFNELNEKIKKLPSSDTIEIAKDLKLYQTIKSEIGGFLSNLSNFNNKNFSQLENSNFKELLNEIISINDKLTINDIQSGNLNINKTSKSRFKTPELLLKHEQKIKKQFEKLIKNPLIDEVLIRDINRKEDYPNFPDISLEKQQGCSSWNKVGFIGLYHKGVKIVYSAQEYLKKTEEGYKKVLPNKDNDYMITYVVAEILFEDIILLDIKGDRSYSCPHIHCYFNNDNCPDNRTYYARQFKLPNGSFQYYEICEINDVLD
jgi:hypothetical protein